LREWTDTEHATLADLGYEGENQRMICPIKATPGQKLTVEQRTVNALHSATRALAERGKLPAQDHIQGATPGRPMPMADRRDHRCGPRPAPPSTPAHDLINPQNRATEKGSNTHS
jgi:hypothetical protein